jgi:predicted RNA-binding protein
MCLSKAWFSGDSTGEPVMEEIAKLIIKNERVTLTSIFGEETVVDANVEEVDFTNNRIILKRNTRAVSGK